MPDPSPAAAPCRDHPEEIAGRYRLGPVLRRSPGCCSHRAEDRLLRRTVSVTLVDGPAAQGLALPEQSWLGRSPEVAEVFDGGPWRGRLFLVTQHPDAPTLAETTPPSGLPVAEVRDLGLAVATALLPLHRLGRGHGGLGAGTVSWSARGAAFSDVGLLPWLARWSDVRLEPPFPAPDAGPAPAGDVYALGRLLDELAPRRVPRAVRALLVDMTAPAPGRPGIEDVLERLRTLPVPSRRRVAAAGASARRGAVVAAVALLLGAGVGLGVVVNASGGGASAYASAAGATRVPGVPPPPAAPVAPPLPATPAAVEPPRGSAASQIQAMRRAVGSGDAARTVAAEGSSHGTAGTPHRSDDTSHTPARDGAAGGSGTRTDADDARADSRTSSTPGHGSDGDDRADGDRGSGKDGGTGKDRDPDDRGSGDRGSGSAGHSGTSRSGKDRSDLPLERLVKGITERAGGRDPAA